ncbi:unnamed protein product [Gulo gulo]|uniref:Secreted protein n=1 Tax=Gulo gulo TaxID=48420 RepID=A0A9X9LDQ0_GULGU|nr:unnamed protein product [Gulo gulo]
MTYLLAVLWMRLCDWFRPSSLLTSMGKCAQLAGSLAVIPSSLMSRRAKSISLSRSERRAILGLGYCGWP